MLEGLYWGLPLVSTKKLESAVGGCILLLKFMIFGSGCLVIYTVRRNLLSFTIVVFGSCCLMIYTVRRNLLSFTIAVFGNYSLVIDTIE